MATLTDKTRKLVHDFNACMCIGDYVVIEVTDGQYCIQIDSRFGAAPAPLLWVKEYAEVKACAAALRKARIHVEWRKAVDHG